MKSFCKTKSLFLTAAVLLTCACFSPNTHADSPQGESPSEGLLVLQNGNILRGKVLQQGDLYQVQLSHGQLQVRAEQVEFFCKTIDQAYKLRSEARGGSSADTHLDLARWCLRHNLFDYAAKELSEAEATDPKHPRLAYLQRHLQQVIKMAARKEVQRAKAAEVTQQPPPNPETLEKAPRWARALFVRQIQPLVVQSCATTGCHQCGTDSNFQLNRLALEGAGHPKVTLQNLASTLEQIDWQSANQSALLQRASKAHGAAGVSVPLAPHKLKVLESWISQLAIAHNKQNELHQLPPVTELAALSQKPQKTSESIRLASHEELADPFDPAAFNQDSAKANPNTAKTNKTPAKLPAVEEAVPHVLAPSEPQITPLPEVE